MPSGAWIWRMPREPSTFPPARFRTRRASAGSSRRALATRGRCKVRVRTPHRGLDPGHHGGVVAGVESAGRDLPQRRVRQGARTGVRVRRRQHQIRQPEVHQAAEQRAADLRGHPYEVHRHERERRVATTQHPGARLDGIVDGGERETQTGAVAAQRHRVVGCDAYDREPRLEIRRSLLGAGRNDQREDEEEQPRSAAEEDL